MQVCKYAADGLQSLQTSDHTQHTTWMPHVNVNVNVSALFTILVAVACRPSAVHMAVSGDHPTRPCMLFQLQILQQL